MDRDAETPEETPTPRRYRGPEGLGEEIARALGERAETGGGFGAVEEESFLRQWFSGHGGWLGEEDWQVLPLLSRNTSEHEVRYRESDHRAVKRTWPGTFGNVPKQDGGHWIPAPATPGEYLLRQALQNEFFGDEIRIEGAMVQTGPSMVIGQPANGISLIASQPFLKAADENHPHPSESEISELLLERGFEQLQYSFFGWRHHYHSLVVLDAKPDNFIKTEVGILPIDLLMTQLFTNS